MLLNETAIDEAQLTVSRANDHAGWPWQAEPYRLWSLHDMMRHSAGHWFTAVQKLEYLKGIYGLAALAPGLRQEQVTIGVANGLVGGTNALLQRDQGATIADIQAAVATLPFSAVIKAQLTRFIDAAKESASEELDEARLIGRAARLEELSRNIAIELESHTFLVVPENKRRLYEQPEPPFGADVANKFPDATRDIAAACRCFALDEWTACVFHLMRVLEHGLRPMATRFSVTFAVDSWHKVISGIEDGLASLRNKTGLTEQDRKEITYYSDAASQFRYFKDAWRNHVSHAREHYDERDAEKVQTHVREFMQHLAIPM